MDNSLSESTVNQEQRALPAAGELGILVLAPTSNDARLTTHFLQKAGYDAAICEG